MPREGWFTCCSIAPSGYTESQAAGHGDEGDRGRPETPTLKRSGAGAPRLVLRVPPRICCRASPQARQMPALQGYRDRRPNVEIARA